MRTTEIKAAIAETSQRRDDIALQHETANAELRKVQKAFAKGKEKVENVTQAQAHASGLAGTVALLDDELSGLQSEYSIAERAEQRADQLQQIAAKCDAANASWSAYAKAHADATRAVEIAAKSLLAADQNQRDRAADVARFCSGSTVSLDEAKAEGIDTTGAMAIIPFFAANATGIISDSETQRYEQHLNELMQWIERCGAGLRPCPSE